jgi:hypothetical protein
LEPAERLSRRSRGHRPTIGDLEPPQVTPALPLAKLTPNHIEKAYSEWATGGSRDGKPGGLSPLTRRYIHVVLKSALARAVEQQLLVRNPADILTKRLPKAERVLRAPFLSAGSLTNSQYRLADHLIPCIRLSGSLKSVHRMQACQTINLSAGVTNESDRQYLQLRRFGYRMNRTEFLRRLVRVLSSWQFRWPQFYFVNF